MTADTYQRSYFTFGPDQSLPDGTNGANQFVIVVGPAWLDRRAVFMQWLGSNDFAFEYDDEEWNDRVRKYFEDVDPHTAIRVDELTVM